MGHLAERWKKLAPHLVIQVDQASLARIHHLPDWVHSDAVKLSIPLTDVNKASVYHVVLKLRSWHKVKVLTEHLSVTYWPRRVYQNHNRVRFIKGNPTNHQVKKTKKSKGNKRSKLTRRCHQNVKVFQMRRMFPGTKNKQTTKKSRFGDLRYTGSAKRS